MSLCWGTALGTCCIHKVSPQYGSLCEPSDCQQTPKSLSKMDTRDHSEQYALCYEIPNLRQLQMSESKYCKCNNSSSFRFYLPDQNSMFCLFLVIKFNYMDEIIVNTCISAPIRCGNNLSRVSYILNCSSVIYLGAMSSQSHNDYYLRQQIAFKVSGPIRRKFPFFRE